jgi:UDP-2,3-diacylglucosamine hydrolase
MNEPVPQCLAVLAGKGSYPLILAQSAKAQGVKRLVVIAFKGETDSAIGRHADALHWIRVGQLGSLLDVLHASGASEAVMAGQITPSVLYRVRPDLKLLTLLASLKIRNADTIFGAIGEELRKIGVHLIPASRFMESSMPAPGTLTARSPAEGEWTDINLGLTVAKATSALNIGQTVVIKEGTILAVEAFEGTNTAIKRGGKLGCGAVVVVKVAKQNHDMRFDIPVIGLKTIAVLRKARATALAVEAHRTIILDREEVIRIADKLKIAIVAVEVAREQA